MKLLGGSWAKPGIASLITVALLIVAALAAQTIIWRHTVRALAENAQDALHYRALVYETRLRTRANDLFILKTLAEQSFADGITAMDWKKFHQTAAALMFAQASYDQIRLLDPNGREIFRINWHPQGLSLETCSSEAAATELQDKSDHPYYRESLEAGGDTAVFSSLDSNIEEEKKDVPPKPTLRVSGQILRSDGSLQAIVVLHALGDILLRDLTDSVTDPDKRIWVLNPDGYWLSKPEEALASVQPRRKDETLQKTDPALWQKFIAQKSGSFVQDGTLYTFRKIDPVCSEKENNPLRMKISGADRVKWLLVNTVPEQAIWKESSTARFGIWSVCGLAAVILAPTSYLGTAAIRRRRKSVKEMAKTRRQLDQVMNASLHGMVAMSAVRDKSGKIVDFHTSMANVASERLTGEKIKTCLGSTYFAGGPARSNFNRYCEVVETGQPVTFEYYQGKTALWLSIRAAKWADGIVISFADVTDRRKAQESLQHTTEALEAANTSLRQALTTEQELTRRANAAERAKGEFLAMMSHEIRTPMNGVLGFADMLEKTALEPEQKEYVHTIATSGEALLRIIDDVLDFSRIEAGRVEIENNIFAPKEVLESVCTLLGPRAKQKGVNLSPKFDDRIPDRAVGDAGRLRQVLINLAGNAIKFTVAGSVSLQVRAEAISPTRSRLDFSVADTGAGIAPDKMESIFKPFMQADSSIARRYGGAGLGLAISQRLVKLMGGTLAVESTPGKGSLFSFSLSLEIPSDESATPTVPDEETLNADFAQQYPLRILVAEDDEVNLRLLCLVLKKLGYEALKARNGKEAMEIARAERPDCILMDIHMPEVDGLEATKGIRSIESDTDRSFIAALTADVMPEERERATIAGMDDYLTKPLKRSELVRALILASANAKKSGT